MASDGFLMKCGQALTHTQTTTTLAGSTCGSTRALQNYFEDSPELWLKDNCGRLFNGFPEGYVLTILRN